MTSDLTSAVANLQFLKTAFVLASWAGSALAGSIKLQASDMAGQIWTDIDGTTVAFTEAGSQPYNIANLGYPKLRAVFTNAFAQIVHLTAHADVAGSLNNTYFLINSTTSAYYVWFNVNGAGTDPAVPGRDGVEVDLATGANAAAVAAAIKTALDAVLGTPFTVTRSLAVLTITCVVGGNASPASDGAVPTGFTISTTGSDGQMLITISAKES